MICYDASYQVCDNPLQTNRKALLYLLQKALWQLLQLVCTDLYKSFSYSFHEMQNLFDLTFGWNSATKVFVPAMIHGGLRLNQQ